MSTTITPIPEDYASIAQRLREIEGSAPKRYAIWYSPSERTTGHGWVALPNDGSPSWRTCVEGEPSRYTPSVFDTRAEAQEIIDNKPDGAWSREDMSVKEFDG